MKGSRALQGALAAAALLACALPGSALADSVKIGSTLQAPHNVTVVANAGFQVSSATPQQLVSPADGVITEWSFKSADLGMNYSLFVLHPTGAGGFNVTTGIGGTMTTAGPPEKVYTQSAPSLPIAKGDAIALSNSFDALPVSNTGMAGDVVGTYMSPLTVGGSAGPPNTSPSRELLLQATVKFCNVPNVLKRNLSDARQLIINADCTPVVKRKKVKRKKKRGKVIRQTAPGTTGAPGTAVEITVGKLKKKKRR